MTSLRDAAKQALTILEAWKHKGMWGDWNGVTDALKAALAEPVQEPVAWRWGYRSVTTGEMDWRGYVEIAAHPNLRSPAIIMQPLYAAPPQRKPLTEEEIDSIWDSEKAFADIYAIARAIERAHGIGGAPEERNFCPRCGKRLQAESIHTCTPPGGSDA